MNQDAITLTGVSKQYTIHHEKPTLVEKFIHNREEKFTALHDINLRINKSESVGIIGPNGSGKTTLLKIITGITSPTSGIVKTHGRIISLIDLEAGFHPDLTGEQNIYLSGMILGMGKKEIQEKVDNIIRFAALRQFIDVPLYTYSSGMKLRLGFAVAVHAKPDILILDEGMSVGDRAFKVKAQKKIAEFFKLGKTILIVSHMLEFIKNNCNRIIVLKRGTIIHDGGKALVTSYEKGML
ncbi:MAG: ABC transporter ATP-binding protein [Patescibacteria group bacterium]|nr:ABC transporter ATP-binding protein [Patescibacteria group bacterium]